MLVIYSLNHSKNLVFMRFFNTRYISLNTIPNIDRVGVSGSNPLQIIFEKPRNYAVFSVLYDYDFFVFGQQNHNLVIIHFKTVFFDR